MEPVHVKEAYILSWQREGDGSIQQAIEGIIKMVDITIRSIKQTSILIFSSSCFL